MKNMNVTLIATICFIVVLILVGGVLSYQFIISNRTAQPTASGSYSLPNMQPGGKKPNNSLSSGIPNSSPSVSPTPATFTDSLQAEVNTTVDDGGQADLNAISSESSKL